MLTINVLTEKIKELPGSFVMQVCTKTVYFTLFKEVEVEIDHFLMNIKHIDHKGSYLRKVYATTECNESYISFFPFFVTKFLSIHALNKKDACAASKKSTKFRQVFLPVFKDFFEI